MFHSIIPRLNAILVKEQSNLYVLEKNQLEMIKPDVSGDCNDDDDVRKKRNVKKTETISETID